MDVITIRALDEVHVSIEVEPFIGKQIEEHFSYEVPGAKHMPKVRSGFWDGRINLFSVYKPVFPKGLLVELYKFCKRNEYQLDIGPGVMPTGFKTRIPREFIDQMAAGVTVSDRRPREYQVQALVEAANLDRALFLSSTSSGKTLMIFLLSVYYAQLTGKPSLIMTTRTNLVHQAGNDIERYATQEVKDEFPVSLIADGADRLEAVKDARIVISTWQSALRADKAWMNQFGAIIVDEAHSWKSDAFTKIMSRADQVKYRFGFTGSLDGTTVNKMVLIGHFGQVITLSTNKERVDAGDVAKPIIKMLRLDYPDEDRKRVAKYRTNAEGKQVPMEYADEIEHVISSDRRMDFLFKLCSNLTGNTLVLFNRNEKFGIPLYERLSELKDRTVRIVYGKTETEERLAVQELMESRDDVLAVASVGTFSEGMSTNNIRNVVLAWPMKGRIRVLQSIGRGLRKMDGKDVCRFYDLVDDLRWKRRDNFLWRHAMLRCELYDSEEFDYSWAEFKL